MKFPKFILPLVAVLGIEFSLIAQEVPNPLDNIKPWVNDSTPAYKAYRTIAESGVVGGRVEFDIVRNAEENWVSKSNDFRKTFDFDEDGELDSIVITKQTITRYFGTDQVIDSVVVSLVDSDSIGNVLDSRKFREVYDGVGKLLYSIYFDGDTSFVDVSEGLCPEGGIVTESNDTTICSFTNSYGAWLNKYNKYGDLVYSSTPWSVYTYDLEYNEVGNIISKSVNSVSENGSFDEKLRYEYDSKGQLIREISEKVSDGSSFVSDYVYDHNGNLTLEFNYHVSDNVFSFYDGNYTIHEYEGGKKMYEPFDAIKYPTDNYPANSPVAKHGKLQVKGANIVDVNGNVVQLKGVSTHGIAWFSECYSEASINSMVEDWGVNVLRIASYVENQINKEEEKDAEWHRTFIDSMVNLCEKKGIYCIIDWHVLFENKRGERSGDPWFRMKEAKEFFEYMSKKHAGKAHVMYEICNEPSNESEYSSSCVSWARVKSYAQEIIDVIVENDPNSIIIVGTPVWSQRVVPAAYSPLDYPNAMYALHFYAVTHKGNLRNHADIAIEKGCPIIVSEFGFCGSGGDGILDVRETCKWLNWMNENDISWVNWNFADKDESSSLLTEGSCESGEWLNLSQSGRILKWALFDENLSGADSIIYVENTITKLGEFLKTGERMSYFQSCVKENSNNLENLTTEDFRDCVYAKECVKENPDIAEDPVAIQQCVDKKRTDVDDIKSMLYGVEIYPNITENYFMVNYDKNDYRVSILDLSGFMVNQQSYVRGKNWVDISYLASGVYLVEVECEGKIYYEKVIKK